MFVLLAGGGSTAFATLTVQRAEQRNAERAMEENTTLVVRALLAEAQHYSDAVRDVAAGLNTQANLTRADFFTATSAVTKARLPGATSLSFVAPATTAAIPATQVYWRRQGAVNLRLAPAHSDTGEHSFVVYGRTLDSVPVPIGVDLSPINAPAEALATAERTGQATMSQAYVLVKDRDLPRDQQQLSFVIAMPVYAPGDGSLRGWVVLAVHGTDFLRASIAEQTNSAVSVALAERRGATTFPIVTVGDPDASLPLVRERTVTIAQREWRLTIRPTARLLSASDRRMGTIALAGGSVVTLLVAALVALLIGGRNRALARVEEATAALRSDLKRRKVIERTLREREDELRRLALHDSLTGLANRAALEGQLEAALREQARIGLLLIDLNGFKPINDMYGHAAGDLVLAEFSRLLVDSVRAHDVVARIGGDEFVVLLAEVPDEAHAVMVAQRILDAAAAGPVRVDEDTVPIRASIGVTIAQPGDTPKEVQRRADVAMYHAKRTGSHNLAVHDPAMVDRRTADAALADDILVALERDELRVVYQPIVDLGDGSPVAAETLLRWEHPRHGLVPPDRFIALAERNGSINAIGLWVLEQACRQALQWDVRYVSVNMSPRQLQEPAIVGEVLEVLRRTGLAPAKLVLEVTESVMVDETAGIPALRELRAYGIRIAIDDFGTGYSSLHYLTRMPVDILKIDRSFVNELNGTPEGAAVTEAVLRLSHALHLTTIAEGIETSAQARELRALGCHTGQGYLYARPQPATELRGFAAPLDGQPLPL